MRTECFGSASIGKSELERYGVGGLVLSFDFSLVPGLGEFLVTVGKHGLFFAEKFVLRGDVSDGGVEAHSVVVINEARDEAAGLLDVERGAWANAAGFERLVPAFDFAVGLGIVRRSFDVGETGHADELFEVLGNELGPIVGNDPWLGFGVLFQSALDDDLYIGLGHGLAQLLVDDEAGASVEQRAEVVKRPGHVDVRDVHMPLLVRGQWLNKPVPFFEGLPFHL